MHAGIAVDNMDLKTTDKQLHVTFPPGVPIIFSEPPPMLGLAEEEEKLVPSKDEETKLNALLNAGIIILFSWPYCAQTFCTQ